MPALHTFAPNTGRAWRLLLTLCLATHAVEVTTADSWAQWRGPTGTGVGHTADPPLHWDETRNIRWKTAIPGLGHSTPVLWGDRLFLTTALAHGEKLPVHHEHADGAHDNLEPEQSVKFIALAVNRQDGEILWQRTLRDEQPHEGSHHTGSWASHSPVADEEHLFVSFGSRGLYCLDHQGRPVWDRDLGDMQTRHGHGEGSSPALYGDRLIVNWDHQGQSFVTALDKQTGRTLWRQERDEITSWSTPLIVEHRGKAQVIIAATGAVRSYDLATGEPIWSCRGLSRNVCASPVAADGRVYVTNNYDWPAMLAIRLDRARGDITDSDAVIWSIGKYTPYVPSPLLYDGRLYFIRQMHPYLSCVDAKTGRFIWKAQRLPDVRMVFASPVGAAGRLYVTGRNGITLVIRHDDPFEILATNSLSDSFSASPILAGQALYLRGERFLYCITQHNENFSHTLPITEGKFRKDK